MAEKLSKKKAREAATGRVVLVATYKGDQLTKWRGWYNYPIEKVKCKVENVKCWEGVNELGRHRGDCQASRRR